MQCCWSELESNVESCTQCGGTRNLVKNHHCKYTSFRVGIIIIIIIIIGLTHARTTRSRLIHSIIVHESVHLLFKLFIFDEQFVVIFDQFFVLFLKSIVLFLKL